MGYKRPQTVYKLVFDDHEGLEVRAASVPIGRLIEVSAQAEKLREGDADSFESVADLFALFGESLRSWNLEEDDGSPIPATVDSVMSLEFGFAAAILVAWFDAVGGVPAPLERRSTSGVPSEELLIPMAPV